MPSTRRLAVAVAAVLAGCGASAAELRKAQTSGFDTDFAVVFSETLIAVRGLYPNYVENPSAGWIKTSWHPVRVGSGQTGEDPLANPDQTAQGQGPNPFASTNLARFQYFIRFRVDVLGGKPWRVRVAGEASVWEAGAVPAPLKGAETPHWLRGRTEALQVAIYRRLSRHAVALTEPADAEAAPERVEPPDLSPFGAIPEPAAVRVLAVRDAAKAADFAALRATMATAFTWSLGSEPSADQAIVLWNADPSGLAAVVAVLEQGCGLEPDGARVVCPAAAATDPGYQGPRARFERVGGQWAWVAFVSEP